MQRGRMLSWFVVWSVAALCCVTLHGVEAMTLKIMTYNIHHGADVRDRVDLERVVQTLASTSPTSSFFRKSTSTGTAVDLSISRPFSPKPPACPFTTMRRRWSPAHSR